MEQGKVKFFKIDKGFGFIQTDGGPDVFFHISKQVKGETATPVFGSAVFFDKRVEAKGPVATRWQLTAPVSAPVVPEDPVVDVQIDPDQDRREGYRPGVMILFRLKGTDEVLLGKRRGFWTWAHSVIRNEPHDAPNWMYSWGVPQGGIEEGETCINAILREISEELGDYGEDGWCREIGSPVFLFKERSTFRVEKDGKVWSGKTLYAFLVDACIPDDVFDFMYGARQDEFWTLPTPEFEGGIQFFKPADAIAMVRQTQKGPKGDQLVRLLQWAA